MKAERLMATNSLIHPALADKKPLAGSKRLLLCALLLLPLAAAGKDPRPCNEATELECLKSAECTLVQAAVHGKYTCRAAAGRCEIGFRQAGDSDIQKDCEARPGCEFRSASCYCPPGVDCRCGGGPPAQCLERGKAK